MEIGKIKFNQFIEKLQSEDLYPFVSSELFKFFMFTRHSDFKRMVDQPRNYSDILLSDDFMKINSRRRECLKISKELFLSLVQKKHPQLLDQFQSSYVDWKKKMISEKFNRFGAAAKRRKGHYFTLTESTGHIFSGKYSEIKGPYYMTSLSTDNYAFAIGIDPMDSYGYFLQSKINSYGHRFIKLEMPTYWGYEKDSFIKDNHQKPRARFDSIDHKERNIFLDYLNFAAKNAGLTDLQMKIHLEFEKVITEILKKQLLYDIKYGRTSPVNSYVKEELQEIKSLYRKAATLCHPDKGGDPEDFKKLSNAYEKRNFEEISKIYNRLIK